MKRKALEYAFLEKKNKHSKLENLFYTELKTQKYFLNGEITKEQAQNLFSYQVRMANFSVHSVLLILIFSCPTIKENVILQGNYQEG